jgi:quercetin dioxygenase-like cupin family protein
MKMQAIPFGTTDWSQTEKTEHGGIGGVRVRMVEYSPGYLADHWCSKGHILLVLEGELETELADGRRFTLKAGMSYQVADGAEPHRSSTQTGARLFIVD